MPRIRAYINPRDDSGNFTGFQEVTEDVDFESMGTIKQQIDSNEYDVGVFKFDEFTLKLRNEHGKYSDVDVLQSIFRFRRAGSKFKLTWEPASESAQCGFAVAGASSGATISEEVDILVGVLNDSASRLNITDQKVTFRVLSADSVFPAVEAPFSDINIGDLYSEILLTILDQAEITEYLTVSASNFTLGLDQTIDVVSQYENQTVKEVLDDILFQSNSVLYIKDQTVFIKPRDGGNTALYTFRGQASNNGIEDIINISDVSTGVNQVFNFWTWKGTTLVSKDESSITSNGVRKKEFESDAITNTAKRQAILDAQKTQFRLKKQSFNLTASINPTLLTLAMLDQIRVDYPTTFIPAETDGELPIYGIAVYGESRYGFGQFSITISEDVPYKIMGIDIDTKKQQMKFKLKEI